MHGGQDDRCRASFAGNGKALYWASVIGLVGGGAKIEDCISFARGNKSSNKLKVTDTMANVWLSPDVVKDRKKVVGIVGVVQQN